MWVVILTKLKELRLMLKITQEQISDYLGISVRQYRYIESGARKPSYEVLCKLEDLFQMSHRELLSVDNSHCTTWYQLNNIMKYGRGKI